MNADVSAWDREDAILLPPFLEEHFPLVEQLARRAGERNTIIANDFGTLHFLRDSGFSGTLYTGRLLFQNVTLGKPLHDYVFYRDLFLRYGVKGIMVDIDYFVPQNFSQLAQMKKDFEIWTVLNHSIRGYSSRCHFIKRSGVCETVCGDLCVPFGSIKLADGNFFRKKLYFQTVAPDRDTLKSVLLLSHRTWKYRNEILEAV